MRNKAIANGDIVKINADELAVLLPQFKQVRTYSADDAQKLADLLTHMADKIKVQAHKAKTTEILSRSEIGTEDKDDYCKIFGLR